MWCQTLVFLTLKSRFDIFDFRRLIHVTEFIGGQINIFVCMHIQSGSNVKYWVGD